MHWWPFSSNALGVWSVFGELGVIAVAGLALACLATFLWFLLADAPEQIRIRDERIAQLGGAPDAPVQVPQLSSADAEKVGAAISALANLLNNEGQDACDKAKVALACIQNIRSVTPSECASKTNEAFNKSRSLTTTLLGTGASTGLLNAGDPMAIDILNQAIQRKDRQIFIDFDDYGRRAKNALYFLSLIEIKSDERARLFEPALNITDGELNGWQSATQRFCEFIGKTNERITEIRRQLSR